jgi:hypothetical protein
MRSGRSVHGLYAERLKKTDDHERALNQHTESEESD